MLLGLNNSVQWGNPIKAGSGAMVAGFYF